MIQSEEVGFEADVWAFGCIAYRLFTGTEAFDSNIEIEVFSTDEVLDNMKIDSIQFDTIHDPICKDFIQQLLIKDSENRSTFESIKKHE
mmetsp:Transcript_76810/g.166280  ORF Transcript_76810/g.166280 Transcript_76810/m.166280 type:complete len:89 (+) Transcript_76810:735-1001(+)